MAATQVPGIMGDAITADGHPRRWSLLAILLVIILLSYVDRYLLSVLLEPIRKEFGLSDTALGLLSGAPFAISYALSSLPFARFADSGSRKAVLLVAFAIWTTMTLGCGLAMTFALLFAARIGVGIGEGGSQPPVHALIASYFPVSERGRAFALLTGTGNVGMAIALALGGTIAASFGWRAAFLVMVLASLPVFAWAAVMLVEPIRIRAQGRTTNMMGSARELLGKRSFLLLLCATATYALFLNGPMISFVPVFAIRVLGVDIATTGLSSGTVTAVATISGALIGGTLSDRMQARDARWLLWLPAAGLVVVLGLALTAFTVPTSVYGFFLLIALIYFFLAVTIPSISAAVQFVCGDAHRATATALVLIAMSVIGGTFGPLFTGMISDALAPSLHTESLRYGILCMVVTGLVPAILLFVAGAKSLVEDARLQPPGLQGLIRGMG